MLFLNLILMHRHGLTRGEYKNPRPRGSVTAHSSSLLPSASSLDSATHLNLILINHFQLYKTCLDAAKVERASERVVRSVTARFCVTTSRVCSCDFRLATCDLRSVLTRLLVQVLPSPLFVVSPAVAV